MDGAMIYWKGLADYKQHNSFLFFKKYKNNTINLRVVIPGMSNQKIKKFAIVFREYNTDKKKVSSTQLTLKYPHSKSLFFSNVVNSCDTKYDFWFTKDTIPATKFYYSTVTFSLATLPLSDGKVYDVSIKSENIYFHKYYIALSPKEEFNWTYFQDEFNVGQYLYMFETMLRNTIGHVEAEKMAFRVYLKMLNERGNTETPITQLIFDGKDIEFKNITPSLLKEDPELLEQLCDDPQYLKNYALKKFQLDEKFKEYIQTPMLSGFTLGFTTWFGDVMENFKPTQKALANAVNICNVSNITGTDKDVDDVIIFYSILKPFLNELHNHNQLEK